jgi:hypothetical protein
MLDELEGILEVETIAESVEDIDLILAEEL